jgi:hypothetical protein
MQKTHTIKKRRGSARAGYILGATMYNKLKASGL